MRSPRNAFSSIFDNPVLVGTVTILVVLVAVYLSYIAENGLPFIPTYTVNVQVADGGELNKNDAVRIGGARVGQVLKITAEPANRRYGQPYAQLQLALDKNLEPLAATTKYQVRLSSVLGGQYVELFPGTKAHGAATVPDGGTLVIASAAAQDHNIPYVDFSQALDVFGPKTQQGIRSVAEGYGNAFAGRGTALNDAITATAQLLPPLTNVLNIFSAPSTELSRFISGLDSTTAALAPEANTLSDLFGNAATTFRATDRPALGTTLDQLPATEQIGTTVFTQATPVLSQLAAISQQLRPAAAYLPTAARGLNAVLVDSSPTLRLLTPVSQKLEGTLAAVKTLSVDPAATQAFNVLGVNDLGTAGASAFVGLGAILNTVSAAQRECNLAGLWVRNFASSLSEGDSTGNWLRISTILDPTQLDQSANVAADLHIDTDPQEGNGQCQAGNEVWNAGQNINKPDTPTSVVDNTAPPAGVLAEGQNAGLVPK